MGIVEVISLRVSCDRNQLRLALKNEGDMSWYIVTGKCFGESGQAWLHPEEIKSLVRALFHPLLSAPLTSTEVYFYPVVQEDGC